MNANRLVLTVLTGMLLASCPAYSQNRNSGKTVDDELIDAVAAMDDRQYGKAGEMLGRITAAAPENDAAFYYLGLCRLYTNDIDGAKEALKRRRNWIRRTSGTRRDSRGHIH